jgi:FkbM family methyltransferase
MAMLIRRPYRKIFRKLEDAGITPDHPLWFLRKSRGIIHVGANVGQEAWIYALMGKPVCWFEPIPDTYKTLEKVISNYKDQQAINELVTDIDGKEYRFNIANNDGGSSSIFELDQHKLMYPDVSFTRSINLVSTTLDTAVSRHGIPSSFDALVLDTQGSELLVLQGAEKVLSNFKWIYLECCDFPAYRGGCVCADIDQFLGDRGFSKIRSNRFKESPGVGSYFDVLYSRS